jgi:hypothetical protein
MSHRNFVALSLDFDQAERTHRKGGEISPALFVVTFAVSRRPHAPLTTLAAAPSEVGSLPECKPVEPKETVCHRS